MNTNSIIAHKVNIEDGNYKNSSDRILLILREHGPQTMHNVAEKMGVQLNRISGRFKKLVYEGRAEIIDTIKIGKFNYSLYKAV